MDFGEVTSEKLFRLHTLYMIVASFYTGVFLHMKNVRFVVSKLLACMLFATPALSADARQVAYLKAVHSPCWDLAG